MFGVPVEGMDPMVRRQAKAINFGIIYGISGFGLARQLGIPQRGSRRLHQGIFQALPRHSSVHGRNQGLSPASTGYVRTTFGRKMQPAGHQAPRALRRAFAERQAINAPLQGTAADIIKRAMIRMPEALAGAGLKARMLLQVHDELVFECPEGEADKLIRVAQETMASADGPAIKLSVPLVVEAKAAKTWAAAH